MRSTSSQLRQAFLDYFAKNGHEVVASSPLVPANDATLLFTNAGMVQFKDVFPARENAPYRRAALRALCSRGRQAQRPRQRRLDRPPPHVFRDARELLFGDYFKADAIGFAWEFLTASSCRRNSSR